MADQIAPCRAGEAQQFLEFFEVLLPAQAQKYGLARDLEVDAQGLVHAMNGPGLGAEVDLDLIRRKTVAVLA